MERINMLTQLRLLYYHPGLNIGMLDIRNAWLLEKEPVKLITGVHRGNLIFRMPGSGKRISYQSIKKGLIKKTIIIQQPFNLLPF